MAGEPLPESLAAEGRAMRRALAEDFAAALDGKTRVIVALDPRFPTEDGPWSTVSLDFGSSLDRFREIAGRADYTLLIAPETMGTLERLTRAVEETGTRPLGPSPEAIALTADKAALGRWFARHGIPTPPFQVVEPAKGLPEDWTGPAVLKPIDGAGSIDTFRIDDPNNPPDGALGLAAGLLQPLVAGETMSASLLVSPERGAALIAIGRQRIETREGRFAYRGGSLPTPCPEASPILIRAVESIPGLRGFIGVDFLWDADQGAVNVLEINPRPTTSCVGLCRALPRGLLADAWLAGLNATKRWDPLIDQIAGEVEAAPMVRFDADGRVVLEDEGDAR